jgi:hypothetical protein
MKPRTSFCAFTKFRQMTILMDPELKLTKKGTEFVQTQTDHLVFKCVQLMRKNQRSKTLRGQQVASFIQALRIMGISIPACAPYDSIYSARLGYHVVKKVHPSFRMAKDAPKEVYKLYLACLQEIIGCIRREVVDTSKRLAPTHLEKMLKKSKLSHLCT